MVKVPAMGNLQATLTGAGTLALGLPTAALSASVTGAGSFSVRVPETGNVAVSVVGGATLGVLVYPTGNLHVTVTGAATGLVTKFVAAGNLLVSVTGTSIVAKLVVHAPSSQSGAVPTTFPLHEHYKDPGRRWRTTSQHGQQRRPVLPQGLDDRIGDEGLHARE